MKTQSAAMQTLKQALPTLAPALLGLVALVTLGGCVKERPYEEIYKPETLEKSLIASDARYLYVPSQLDSSRSSTVSRPNWMGSEKVVKLRFTKDSLEVLEVEKEERFAGNETNHKLVLSIPVEHLEYRCAENSVGECSNKEEENGKIDWSRKSKFKPDLGGLKVAEMNTLPSQIGKLFGEDCVSEVGSRPLKAQFEGEAINLQVERTFNMRLECVSSLESLGDLTVSEVHHYSLVKLDTMASKGYEAVLYPESDQNLFGFFTTELSRLSVDNRDRAQNEVTYLNRWNPARKMVTYFLSDNFFKPENAKLLRATHKGVEAINNALAAAGAGFRLALSEERGKVAGDIRDSMIVMVEDPMATGLLGYGPSIANPETGEILSARTVMYPGVMRKYIRNTYEEYREDRLRKQVAAARAAEAGAAGGQANAALSQAAAATERAHGHSHALKASSGVKGKIKPAVGKGRSPSGASPKEVKKAERMLRDYARNRADSGDLRDRVQAKQEDCVYLAQDFNFAEAVGKAIDERLEKGELKPWEELSEAERAALQDIILPYVWIPTLVHELGHNLGLRHNFQGSEDKENFYTAEELKALGTEHEVPYSSVMDYAARTINELHTMGKYDIAALRFGYVRQAELKDGTLIPIQETLSKLPAESLKEYGYCTDEHVDLNAGCKRQDEGTSLVEMARFQIKDYEDRYRWSNFRNGARNFSLTGDAAYASRIESIFYNLRMFLEARDRILSRFPDITPEQWQQIPFLKDLDEAVAESAKFFLRVLATPDVHCVIMSVKDPKQVELARLSELTDAISCFDPELMALAESKGFAIIGQGGKSFQSRKAPSNPSPYADQIDVRGIWIDKLLAARFLLARELDVSTLDQTKGNYLSYGNTAEEFKKILAGMATLELPGQLKLDFVDGETLTVPWTQKLGITEQIIEKKSGSIRKALKLPEGDTLLARELIGTVMSELPHLLAEPGAESFMEVFRVASFSPYSSISVPRDSRTTEYNGLLFLALPGNEVALKVINDLDTVRILSKVDQEKLQAILEQKAQAVAFEGPESPEEKAARELSAETIQRFMDGGFESEETYGFILEKILR